MPYWINLFAYLGLRIFYLQFSPLPCMQQNGPVSTFLCDSFRGTAYWLAAGWACRRDWNVNRCCSVPLGWLLVALLITQKQWKCSVQDCSLNLFYSCNNVYKQEDSEPVFKPTFPVRWPASLIFAVPCWLSPCRVSSCLQCSPTYRVTLASSIAGVCARRWDCHDYRSSADH